MVASCGLYFPMVAKSPESQTTVVPVAFNCSRELVMIFVLFIVIAVGERWWLFFMMLQKKSSLGLGREVVRGVLFRFIGRYPYLTNRVV